jgi:hypothetical protein
MYNSLTYWKTFIILLLFTIIIYLFLLNNQSFVEGFTNNKADINCYVFYTDSCPHSKKFFRDNWGQLKAKYGNQVVFNKIDCNDPNMKPICKNFEIKSVPTIYIIKDNLDTSNNSNKKIDKIPFNGVRNLENLEKFLNENIAKFNSQNNQVAKKESFNDANNQPTMDDPVDFEQMEDMNNKTYKYCINYRDPKKSKYNLCQRINEKETPNIKSWQGAYSTVNEYLNKVTKSNSLVDKKTIAFKHQNDIADWHLCDPLLLQSIKTNVESLPNNKDDMDVNTAIQYACGFSK